MANPTTNLSMTKPTVGGSTDTWGTTLNEEVVDVIDAVFAIGGTDVTMSDIKFNSVALQETGAGTDTVKVQAPSAVTTSYTLTMPAAVGASGQILRTSDASGTLAWVTDEEGDLKSVADATNGGLDVTNGTGPDVTLAVDFNDLAAAVVDVAADSIGILDATDNDTKKETIADLVSAMGGTGLTGASGQLSVDAAQTQITSVGALDAGSITSNFGAIDNGSSAITTTGTVSATTLAGTLSTATQNSVTTATNLTTVGALNAGSISTDFGTINVGSSTITGGGASFTTISGSTSLALATGATVTGIDNGALGSSATLLVTASAVKTYVDAQVGSFDTLAEVLAAGNTTGSTNIIVSASQKITTDTIDETTAAAGVTIDSVLVKDNTVTATTFTGALVGNASTATTAATVTGATQAAITSAANLATVGTIGTGTWASTDVAVAHGGTGASTAAAAATNLGLGTGDSPQFTAVNVGAASDTTLSRKSAGVLQVESSELYVQGGTDVAVADGGTALSSYAAGDIIYASGTTTLAKLVKGSDTEVLTLASGVPTWAAPTTGDITGVTAGTGLSGGGTSGTVTLNVEAAQSGITSLGTLTSLAVGNITSTGNLVVSGTGPHSIGAATQDNVRFRSAGSYTSGGASDFAAGHSIEGTITGAVGDTIALAGAIFQGSIVTQGTDTNISRVAQVMINTPSITNNLASSGKPDIASTLWIQGAPSAVGDANYALYVAAGLTAFGDNVLLASGKGLGPNGANEHLNIFATGAAGEVTFYTAGTSPTTAGSGGGSVAMTMDASADVNIPNGGLAIGTTATPATSVHVIKNATASRTSIVRPAIIETTASGSAANPHTGFGTGIEFRMYDYSDYSEPAGAIDCVMDGSNRSTPSPDDGFTSGLAFSTVPLQSGGIVEKMRITSAGNVGIGTASPLMRTEIQATARNTVFNAGDWTTWADLRVINPQDTTGGTFPATGIGFMVDAQTTQVNGMAGIAAIAGDDDFETGLVFITRPSSAVSRESMRVLPAGGLTFNGGTAEADALDEYEEGAWTPLIDGSGGTSGQSYTTQSGRYQRVGQVVHCQCVVKLSAKGTITGYARVSGLPLTPNAVPTYNVAANSIAQASISDGHLFYAQQYAGNPFCYLYESDISEDEGLTQVTTSVINDDTEIVLSLTYRTSA